MKSLLLIFSIFLTLTVKSQTVKPDTLTNQTVIDLKMAGFNATIIKAKIAASYCSFDVSTNAMISLKKAGIPDDVITAMVSKINTASTSIIDSVQSTAPGIYYCKGQPCDLMELEPSVYSQAKTGSSILTSLTYGIAKTKAKATLSNPHANLQLDEKSPQFYFYFDKSTTNNFGNNSATTYWFASATSPNEFILIKFTTTKKSRDVVTGSWNSYAGMSSGIDDSNKISFKYEKISAGVYKVYTEQPLEKGEYCFMYAGGSATYGAPMQKVYDFGIK